VRIPLRLERFRLDFLKQVHLFPAVHGEPAVFPHPRDLLIDGARRAMKLAGDDLVSCPRTLALD
jgi:hypothetical protein